MRCIPFSGGETGSAAFAATSVAAAAEGMNIIERDNRAKPSEADIRTALERIVASRAFSKSPQLANFLRFIVETSLAGNAHLIKGYTIATDALGRDTSFDPQNDPIVRVEAVRLRRALDAYYAAEGRGESVVIAMPSGSYVPTFRLNTAPRRPRERPQWFQRHVAGPLRENDRLVMLIVIIAVAVSLGKELLAGAWQVAIKPVSQDAQATGSISEPQSDVTR